MRKRVLNLIIIFVIFAVVAVAFCGFSGETTSFAGSSSDGEYTVLYPSVNDYLYLTNPTLVAVKDGAVAVYDVAKNKIFTAGTEHNEYSPVLSEDEKITDLAFANDTLYYLTNFSRLFDLKKNDNVDLGDKIVTDISSYEGVLYLYNYHINVYEYDGTDFTDYKNTERKIIGSTAFSVAENRAYFVNDGKLYTLDFSSGKTTNFALSESVSSLVTAGDKLYAVSDGKVSKVDFENKSLTLVTNIPKVKHVSSNGQTVVALPVSDNAVLTFDENLVQKNMYGSKSTKEKWFDSPMSVFSDNGNVAVWDKSNARVQYFFGDGNYKQLSIIKNAVAVAVSNTHTVYTDGKIVYVVKNDDISTRTIDSGKNIGAIALTDKAVVIYDVTSKAIYTAGLLGKEFSLFQYSRAGVSKIKAIGGDNLTVYTLAGDIISAVTKTTDFSTTVQNVVSFDVDFTGNVIALVKTETGFDLETIKRTASTLEYLQKATLHGDFDVLSLCDVTIDLSSKNNAYLVDNVKNVLIKATFPFYNKDTAYDKPFDFDDVSAENVTYARSKGTVVYSSINNFLDISDVVPAGKTVAVLGEKDGMYIVMTENKKRGYTVKSSAFLIPKEPTKMTGQVVALFDTVSVFDYPGAQGVSFGKNQVFTLINDCAGFGINGELLKVSYEKDGATKYGYVYKTSVMSYVESIKSQEKEVIAKAKSQHVGTPVKVYAMPDDTSSVLFGVPDGAKLKLLQEYDEKAKFTLIEYKGQQGYILTSALKIDKGLTGGQIAAIVLASATVLITSLYFIVSRRNKKISNKN